MKLRSLLALLLALALLCSCSPALPPASGEAEGLTTQEVPSSPSSAASTNKPSQSSAAVTAKPSVSATPPATAKPSAKEEAFVPPNYEGKPYAVVGDNVPVFETLTTKAYESYPPLDSLGRCQSVHACLGRELMPTEERGSIGMVKPSGWQTAKYDFVDGKYLYNRCHLIGFQLAGENANVNNLITGTRSMNVKGMLPFENMIADYVKETDNHVMYRVTPVFVGTEPVARGVRMEAYSVEDEGEGICFDVYAFNVEPGVEINYQDGTSRATTAAPTTVAPTTVAPTTVAPTTVAPTTVAPTTVAPTKPVPTVSPTEAPSEHTGEYLLNTSTKKIHHPDCSAVKRMSEKNKKSYSGTLSSLFSQGYDTCGLCF